MLSFPFRDGEWEMKDGEYQFALLLYEAQKGGQEAKNTLIAFCLPFITAQVTRVLRSTRDRADLVQLACLRLFQALPTLRPDTKLRRVLPVLVRNTCIDFVRKRSHFNTVSLYATACSTTGERMQIDPYSREDVLVDIHRREICVEIRGAMAEILTKKEQQILLLLYEENLTQAATASKLNICVKTVQRALHAALQKLSCSPTLQGLL